MNILQLNPVLNSNDCWVLCWPDSSLQLLQGEVWTFSPLLNLRWNQIPQLGNFEEHQKYRLLPYLCGIWGLKFWCTQYEIRCQIFWLYHHDIIVDCVPLNLLRGKQIVQGNLTFFNCILGLKCLHEIHVPKLEKTNIFRPTFPVSRVESRPQPESVTVLECDMWHDIWAVTLSSLTSLGATWAGWHVTGSAWQMETLEEIGNSWHCKYNAKTSGHARNIHCNKDEV